MWHGLRGHRSPHFSSCYLIKRYVNRKAHVCVVKQQFLRFTFTKIKTNRLTWKMRLDIHNLRCFYYSLMVLVDFEVWTVKTCHEVVTPTIERTTPSRDISISIPGRRNILQYSCRSFVIVLGMVSRFQVYASGCLVRGTVTAVDTVLDL